MSEQTKGALRSKRVWGAIFTLVGAFGLLPNGITIADGKLIIDLESVAALAGLVVSGGGVGLLGFGAAVAKKAIRGLF